jgi:hypothetical protein
VVVEKQFTEVGSRIWCSRAHGAGAHTVTVHVTLANPRCCMFLPFFFARVFALPFSFNILLARTCFQ